MMMMAQHQGAGMSPVAVVIVAETGTKIRLYLVRSAGPPPRVPPRRVPPKADAIRTFAVGTYLHTYNTFTDERTSTTLDARRRRGVLLLLSLLLLLPHHSAGPRERCSLVRIVFAPLNIGSSGVHSLLSNPTARPSARPRHDIITIIILYAGEKYDTYHSIQ